MRKVKEKQNDQTKEKEIKHARAVKIFEALNIAPTVGEIPSRNYDNPTLVMDSKFQLLKDENKRAAYLKKHIKKNESELRADCLIYEELKNRTVEEIKNAHFLDDTAEAIQLKINHISYDKMQINAALDLLGDLKRFVCAEVPTLDGNQLTWSNLPDKLNPPQNWNDLNTRSAKSIELISVDEIEVSPFEPQAMRRALFDQDSLYALGDSIVRQGQLEPAIVRVNSETDKYQLVVGERRWLAIKLKGLSELECIIQQLTDAQCLEIQYQENHQREDNDALVDAFYYQYLHKQENYSISELADKFGVDRKTVRQTLLLNDLIHAAKIQLTNNRLPKKHAYLIATLPKTTQEEIITGNYAYRDNDLINRAIPFDTFNEIIEQKFVRKLKDAPFNTEDERLHIRGLKCSECAENSVNQPDLFAGEFTGDDVCLNGECFGIKTGTFFRLQREKAAEMLPNPENKPIEVLAKEVPIVVSKMPIAPGPDKPIVNEIIEKPECEFSVPVIIGDGIRRNQTAFSCTNSDCPIHFPKPKKPYLSDNARQMLEDQFNSQVAKQVREKVLRKSADFLDDYKPFWIYNDLVEQLILTLWNDLSPDYREFVYSYLRTYRNCPKVYSFESFRHFVTSFNKLQQSRVLFLLTYKNIAQDDLKRIAKEFAALDYKLLDAKIRHELAPAEHRAKTEDYLGHVENGFDIEIPVLWTHKEDAE